VVDVNEKTPKAPSRQRNMFFCDGDYNLTRENPRQMSFEDELEKKRLENAERAGHTG
jgi:hypothetical protein